MFILYESQLRTFSEKGIAVLSGIIFILMVVHFLAFEYVRQKEWLPGYASMI